MMDTERYIYSHTQVYCANCECLAIEEFTFFIFNLQISVLILQFVFYSILSVQMLQFVLILYYIMLGLYYKPNK